MKKIVSVMLLCCIVIFGGCTNNNEKKYDEAVKAALEGNIEYAKQIFTELPEDYKPEEKSGQSPKHWLNDIDKYYNSKFIGEWTDGRYKLEIRRVESETSGIYLSFDRDYVSPSGIKTGDWGKLWVSDDGMRAEFTSAASEYGGESNSKYYDLKFVDENTIELYFKNELESTLYRK